MNTESNRLQTFANWSVEFIKKETLALLGFYYLAFPDTVKCHFCKIELGAWERGDDVLADHQKWSPSCKLVCRQFTKNVPIDATTLNAVLPPAPFNDVCSSSERVAVSEGCIDKVYPRFPKYREFGQRIASYINWPNKIKQQPSALADAGFFYTGYMDCVTCFWCGGGLNDWDPMDDPFAAHSHHYHSCEYTKRANFVVKIPHVIPQDTTTHECPVCFFRGADHAIPCGHIFCKICLLKIDNATCPICKKSFIATNALRLFFN
jgi:hypothetical protein